MIDKEEIIKNIGDSGIVAVIRADSEDHALKIAEACVNGGIKTLEITFTIPKANRILEKLSELYSGTGIVLGAGTVMDSETARIAILSGAQFIVSPYFDSQTVRLCNRYRIPCMPGAMTVKEVVESMESGADIIKLFPGEISGLQMLKSIKGPLPQAKLMPTGGVNLENVEKWIKSGAFAVGVGSSLIGGASQSDYESITKKAEKFITIIKNSKVTNE